MQPNVNFIPTPFPILRFQAEAEALTNMLKWFIKLSGLVLLSLRTLSSAPNAKLRDQITGSLMRKQIHNWGWTERQAGRRAIRQKRRSTRAAEQRHSWGRSREQSGMNPKFSYNQGFGLPCKVNWWADQDVFRTQGIGGLHMMSLPSGAMAWNADNSHNINIRVTNQSVTIQVI